MGLKREVLVCRISDLPTGKTSHFKYGHSKGIAYNDGGTIKAYVNRCTHMGGPVELTRDGKFLRCRWHGADFYPCTGAVVDGQGPEGTFLKRLELIEKDGTLFTEFKLPENSF